MSISTGSPGEHQGFCVVCGRFVRVDPTRPPGDAPCPNCGALLWLPPSSHGTSLEKGSHVRLRVGARFGPVGIVVGIDDVRRRIRIGFRDGSQVVLVEVSADHAVRSTHPAPPLPNLLEPCSACGAPDRLDPWRSPDGQICVVCRRPPAPTTHSRPSMDAIGQDAIGREVQVLAGPFAGSAATIAARHCVDGRLRVVIAGFDDATVQVILSRADVSPTRGPG